MRARSMLPALVHLQDALLLGMFLKVSLHEPAIDVLIPPHSPHMNATHSSARQNITNIQSSASNKLADNKQSLPIHCWVIRCRASQHRLPLVHTKTDRDCLHQLQLSLQGYSTECMTSLPW
ncbi:hypothetical protein ABBQ38_008669 [Trebouxia sp. C0009 RCD-2024]